MRKLRPASNNGLRDSFGMNPGIFLELKSYDHRASPPSDEASAVRVMPKSAQGWDVGSVSSSAAEGRSPSQACRRSRKGPDDWLRRYAAVRAQGEEAGVVDCCARRKA